MLIRYPGIVKNWYYRNENARCLIKELEAEEREVETSGFCTVHLIFKQENDSRLVIN